MDAVARTSRSRRRRLSVTEIDIHDFNAQKAVSQDNRQPTDDLKERVSKAAELYIAFTNEQQLATNAPRWWPVGESHVADLYLVASGEGFSGAAKLMRAVSSGVIFIASLMSCLASIKCGDTRCEELPAWAQAEMWCLGFFTVEYCIRLFTAHARPPDEQTKLLTLDDGTDSPEQKESTSVCRSTCSWMCQVMNVVDLFSILPFYIEELVSATTAAGEPQAGPYEIIRILRILRVLRVLKLAEVSDSMRLFGRGVKRSRDYIITLALTLVIIMILFASFIFHAESSTMGPVLDRGDTIEDGRPVVQKTPPSTTDTAPGYRPQMGVEAAKAEDAEDSFLNVPDVFWFCVSEITTVGNASKSPVTVIGQTFAIILACFGVFYLSFAQAVIVNSFQEVLREHARTDNGAKQLKRIFDAQPKDAHGRVRCNDIYRAVRRYDPVLAQALEPYLALDDLQLWKEREAARRQSHELVATQNDDNSLRTSSRGESNSTRAKVGSIDYKFFAALMQGARDQHAAQSGDKIVDLESIAMSVELIKEDQDLLREEVHAFFTEHSHMMRAIANKLEIDMSDTMGQSASRYPLPPDKEYHFFVSHSQATGGDQANLITNHLEKRGLKIWYDNNMDEVTAEAMEHGVRKSKAIIVLLTDGMMGRPFCRQEMTWALEFDLDIVGVSEQDPRRGAVDFAKERESAPPHLRTLVDDVEFLAFRRREFEARAMYTEIIKRGKFEKTTRSAETPTGASLQPNASKQTAEARTPHDQGVTPNPSYKQLPPDDGNDTRASTTATAGAAGDGDGLAHTTTSQKRARALAKQRVALLDSVVHFHDRGEVTSESEDEVPPVPTQAMAVKAGNSPGRAFKESPMRQVDV